MSPYIIAILAVVITLIVVGTVYVMAMDNYGHGNKEKATGFINVDVDIRGANPLGNDCYFNIEEIHSGYTAGNEQLSFMEFVDGLGLFSDKSALKMIITVSSSAGMDDYTESDTVEFTWEITEGALTVYKTESNGEPFFIQESGLYHITVQLYYYVNDEYRLQDTEQSSITV